MSLIDNHATLEVLATHLVHDDCEHIFDDDVQGGHCFECTLAHLKKEFDKLKVFQFMYEGLCK